MRTFLDAGVVSRLRGVDKGLIALCAFVVALWVVLLTLLF
jgi:hypothetical protein